MPGIIGDQGGPFLILGCIGPQHTISKRGDSDASCSEQGQAQQHSAEGLLQKSSFYGKSPVLLLDLCCISLLTERSIANESFLWQVFLQCKWITIVFWCCGKLES